MAPRLSGQTSIFGVVFFVSKSLLGIERQKKLEKFAILTRKPRSHARILIYRTWPISAPNCYCNFNGRAAPWAFPLEFVCKSRVKSGVQCVSNGAENSSS